MSSRRFASRFPNLGSGRLPGSGSLSDRCPGPRTGPRPGCCPRPGSARLRSRFSDRGSATVWSIGAIGVLCVVFGVVLALGQAVVVRHRAAGAADLAALAAADHWAEGTEAACGRAERVAAAQGTRLARCAVVGEISDVTAAAGGGPFAVEVRARAGPAGSVPQDLPEDPPRDSLELPEAAVPR